MDSTFHTMFFDNTNNNKSLAYPDLDLGDNDMDFMMNDSIFQTEGDRTQNNINEQSVFEDDMDKQMRVQTCRNTQFNKDLGKNITFS